ncbi:C80 family cysteine peptidase [Roseateles sp.]|uniref:C80 family cysteine peptidase n=1 Tax=Roseateles sp. TaxID=1971397 RepID=UPI002F3FEF33
MLAPHVGLVRLLMEKVGQALKSQGMTWQPVAADLERFIRDELSAVDGLMGGTTGSDALDRAAKSMAHALQTGDMQSLVLAYDHLAEHFAAGRTFAVAVYSAPHGLVGSSTPLFASSEAYRRSVLPSHEAAFLAGLDKGVRAILAEHPDLQGASAALIRQCLGAAITESTFVLEVEHIERLRRSGVAADQTLLEAARRIYPALGDVAQHGLIRPVTAIWTSHGEGAEAALAELLKQYRATTSDQDIRHLLKLDPAAILPGAGAGIDEQRPLAFLGKSLPATEQRLDRVSGSIEIRWPASADDPSRAIEVRFRPLSPGATEGERRLQDQDIRHLDEYLVSHFVRDRSPSPAIFPHEITLSEGRIRVKQLVLARQQDGRGWHTDRIAVRRALNVLGAFSSPLRLEAGNWSDHGFTVVEATPPTENLESLRIQLQMEDDSASVWNITDAVAKHPDNTIWIRVGDDGSHHIVRGEGLLQRVSSETLIAIEIVGHGAPVENARRMALSGYSSKALARRVGELVGKLSSAGWAKVKKVSLYSCALEAPIAGEGYASDFLRKAVGLGWMADSGEVKAYAEIIGGHPRWTKKYQGAEIKFRAPKRTYVHAFDSESGEIRRWDKYPRLDVDSSRDVDPQIVDDFFADLPAFLDAETVESFLGASDDRSLAPPSGDAGPVRQPGSAGKVHEVLSRLGETLTRSKIAKSEGATPDAVRSAVQARLTAFANGAKLDVHAIGPIADAIADGLWQRDPMKLYEGFAKLSRLCNETGLAFVEVAWGRNPQGVVGKATFPSQVVGAFRKNAQLPQAEITFIRVMDAGLKAMDGIPGKSPGDLRTHWLGRQTRALVASALSGRPFVIDADEVRRMSLSDLPVDVAGLDVLEVVHAAARKLSDQASIEPVIYLGDAPKSGEGEWTTYKDGSKVSRDDLLAVLRPERKADMDALRIPPASVDDSRPLSRLGAFLPDAIQTLDREAGTIRIVWPTTSDGSQADTVLAFIPSDADPGSADRARQDADIRAMDDFLVSAFFHQSDSPLNSMPARLTLEGNVLKASRLPLAERTAGRWLPYDQAFRELQEFLMPRRRRVASSPPVADWKADLQQASIGAKVGRDGPDDKLRVLLQMEDDPVVHNVILEDVRRHPDSVVWVQVGKDGTALIRYGEASLQAGAPSRAVKLEIYGHGEHDPATRSQMLAGYRPIELAERLSPVVQLLGLKDRAGQATLDACALETPSVDSSFGEEFLKAAIAKGVVSGDATLVAYGELLIKQGSIALIPRGRTTMPYDGGTRHSHKAGVTWTFKVNRVTGEIDRVDKYPAPTDEAPKSPLPEGTRIEQVKDRVGVDGSKSEQASGTPARQQWSSAGKLKELLRTVDLILVRAGIPQPDGSVPPTLVKAVQDSWMALVPLPRSGINTAPLPEAARWIAEGLWNMDPAALHAGFDVLSDMFPADVRRTFQWGDRPRGMVKDVRFPTRVANAFEKRASLPAAEAFLYQGLCAGVADMAKPAPGAVDTPDVTGRIALGQQTASLVHALLSGKPFVIDVDLLSQLSPSGLKRKLGVTQIDVLEVIQSASRHLARLGIMSESIYMTDSAIGTTPGWETYPDGSRIHRGDLLPGLLPDRQRTLSVLRAPLDGAVRDAAPLARLHDLMPTAKQSLDRVDGTITIKWPGQGGWREGDTVLRFRPIAEGVDQDGRRQQDADIRAFDEFMVHVVSGSVDQSENATPSRLTLTNGVLTADSVVLAKRVNERWIIDHESVQRSLDVSGPHIGKDATANRGGGAEAYGLDTVHAIDSEEARNPRPGRAGELSELFDTLAATQTKGGFTKRAGNAPDAVVEAVQEKLRTLFLELKGVSESDLHTAARSMADGVWQRDPAKIQEGYVKLSALCAVDSGQVAKVTWSDRPIGVVDRVTVPSQLRLTYDTFVSMPLPDAALAHGLQATVAGMDGLPLDAQADAGSRAFARQTLALTEAVLSGQPFTVDADAVFRMSTSKDVDARATLDVLDVTHATAMQLASRDVMATPIYLTDARQSPDVGWERYPDGSLVHRGDILPNILPERAETMERLRTPMAIAVDETRPLPRLARFMPEATQTLDRRAGTVTIVWPEMRDGRQAGSVLRFAPSDAGAGTEGRRLQDADILAMDDFIIREFFPSAGPVRNSMPGELKLVDGTLVAGRSVLAERQGGRWVRDSAAMREALSILSPRPVTPSASRPATSWHGELGDAITGLKVADQGSRLLVHLQMEDDLVMLHGARRTIRNHPEETVWIQVDRDGNHVIRHGAELLQRAAPDLPVKIEISGHGSHDPATRTQRLAGYGAADLANRVASVIGKIDLTSRAKNLTLVSCAIEAPVVSDSFGATFLEAAIDQKIVHQDATVVAYGEVLVRNNRLEGTQPSRTTRRHPGAKPEKHAPGVTWQFKKDAATGNIVRTDKYPAGSAEDGHEADDDDSALKRLAEFRDEAYGARAASTGDGLAGHTLRMNGIDVPLTFLASLGAQIDGQPLTADQLHAIADLPDDPVTRLKIDPELLGQWTSLLSDQPDAEISDRIRALGGWLDGRERQSGAGAAFTGEASPETRATVDRLKSAFNADAVGDGHALSDAELLKAARGEDAGPTSLLGEILQNVSESTRLDFENWLTRTGQSLDGLKDMAPSRPGGEADTPVEKVAKAIERRAKDDDGIDFDKMVRVDKGNALASLQEIGVVRIDQHGLRLDASRLKAYIDSGDGVTLAYAGRALRKMSGKAYRALLDSAPDSVRPFMTEMRGLPSAGKAIGKAIGRKISAGFDKLDGAVDYIDTVQGIYNILANWDRMSPTQKGLSIVQSASFIISPLAMMAGQALSKLAPVVRSGVLRVACAGLASGAANVGLSALGLASCALEWQALKDSGQGIDSYAGKSAIANTVMACTSFVIATVSFVVSTAVFLSGGAAAVAGTALGAVSSCLGAAAAPLAVLMFITNAVVQAALWFEEFGQYIRDGTSLDDKALAGFAKAFGFSTDVTRRAETEKAAREAAAKLSQSLKAQFQSDMEFEAKQLAKQGYDTAMIPDTEHPVKPVTFYDSKSSQKYNFTLQPQKSKATTFRKRVHGPMPRDLPSGTAWLSMDRVDLSWGVNNRSRFDGTHGERQLFQVGNLVDATVVGSPHDDVFHLRKTDGVQLERGSDVRWEKNGNDEIQIDAEHADVTIEHEPLHDSRESRFPLSIDFPGLDRTYANAFDRITVRNAAKASVSGSYRDDRLDISATSAEIRGRSGRNTYVVRNGNRIFVTSSDVAVWSRGVSGATIDVGDAAASLLIKVDVLHESLSFRRDGKHLDVLIGKESLKLEKYFEPLDRPSPGPLPNVTFVDAVGTVVVLITPELIEKKVAVTELDKHLIFSTELPGSRRTLTGDNAHNRFHLSSGAGDLRVVPMTGMPMELFLNVPVERLGLREEGEDLVIVETPPSDALATFAPLRLRLSGQRRSDSDEPDQNVTVWVTEQDKAPGLLVLPKPGKAVDATVSVVTPAKAATSTSATSEKSSVAGQGTDGPEVIDARALKDGTVLRGGSGADTYRIKAGQTLVIDNRAADGALDVLELEGVDWLEFLKSHQFSRSGGDLVIRMATGQITVQDHAARPDARHLSLRVGDRRFALPVIQDGFMVHLPSPNEDHVLATAPGAHLVLPRTSEAWGLSSVPRTVWMQRSTDKSDHGMTVEAVVKGDRPSTVMLVDYHRAPEDWNLTDIHFREDGNVSGAVNRVRFIGPSDTSPLHRALVNSNADPDAVYPLTTVQDYLQSRGMPKEVASQIRSNTFQRLQRLHHLLAVAVDSRDWLLPAAFIDAYAESGLTPSADQGPMIRFLASRRSISAYDLRNQEQMIRFQASLRTPWAYDELILRSKLTMTQLQGFESWASVHVEDKSGSPQSVEDLTAFIQMLKGEKPPTVKPSLLAKVLELKGCPTAFAQQLALAMHAADTLDDAWVAGMLQAGVIHHGVLRRLKDAGISPQDVVLGNANRKRYEGSDDRSALIAVSASEGFKSPVTTAYRYTLEYYLQLDKKGNHFGRTDRVPQPGIVYDLVPGVIVDERGESPDPKKAYDDWKKKYDKLMEEERRKTKAYDDSCKEPSFGGANSCGSLPYVSQIPQYKEALSSVVRLAIQGFAKVESYQVGGTFDGRSTPGNLVDGFEGADEVVAWRPGGGPARNGEDFIQFDFLHPVALTGVTLRTGHRNVWPRDPWDAESYWRFQAQREDGQWISLCHFWVQNLNKTRSQIVDTNGVPYSRYRLIFDPSKYSRKRDLEEDWEPYPPNFNGAWFSEITFTTGETGRNLETELCTGHLQRAGYGSEEIRSLFLQGLRDEREAKRAGDLRRHFGPLPAAAVVEDVQLHDSLNEAEIKILKDLRTGQGESTGWSPEALLKAVRQRSAHRHLQLLNERLPFFDPASIQDEAHRQFVAQIKEGLVDRRDASAKESEEEGTTGAGTVPVPRMPVWLKGLVVLSPLADTSVSPDLFRQMLFAALRGKFGATDPATNGAHRGDTSPYEAVQRLLDEQYVKLAASHGEARAMRDTAPWYLHLLAVAAAASGRALRLLAKSDTSQNAPFIRAVIEAALPRLQAAQNEGLLHVVIASSMPPVGNAAAWTTSTRSGMAMHLSPGTALVTEYAEARNGLPVPRLKAGGFKDNEAKSLFDSGVQTLDQVTSAIEWRQLFPVLSWKTVADVVLYDGTREPVSGPGASGSPVRVGLTQAQLVELIDRRLPIDAPRLFGTAMARARVLEVHRWLDAMGPSTANLPIAAQLTQAAGGLAGALSSAIGLAVKKGLLHRGASTVTETSAWAPSTLRGFVSLEPLEDGATPRPFDAPVFNVLKAYEQLLDTLGQKLLDSGHNEDAANEALRPNYLELAVIRAAISGQRLRLHVQAGESAREQAFITMIEARLTDLQDMDARNLVDVGIVSSMPPVDVPDAWKTEVSDGKTRHLSTVFSLEAWRRAKDGQAIPRLEAGGFSREDARALYTLGVRTSELVTRAIEMRKHFGRLPPDVVAKDVVLPPLPVEDLQYAIALARNFGLDRAELLAAVRGNKVKVLREVLVNEDHLPYSWRDLLEHTYGKWFPLVEQSPVRSLLSSLTTVLGEALAHWKLEAAESVKDVAWAIVRSVSSPFWRFRGSLSEAIQELQWWHARRDLPSDVVMSTPWAPKRLQGMASLGVAGEAGQALAAPTAIALQAFEVLLETLEAALRQRGDSEASVTRAMGPHFLRLTALHAAASGRQLRLHVPPTSAHADRELRDLLDLAIPFLEKARSAGLVDVAIASARSPVNPGTAWTTEEMDGKVLHVSSKRPLESAWNEARRSYPFHRLTAAGYGDFHAWMLEHEGVDTVDLADRAIQLRRFFGDLSPEAVLADLGKPAFTAWDERLAGRLGWLATKYSLDALALVRGGAADPVIRVSVALPRSSGIVTSSKRIQQIQKDLILQWLSATQGIAWSADNIYVNAFVDIMGHAATGHVESLTEALAIARNQGFAYHGQTTVEDAEEWLPETVRRHAKLVQDDRDGVSGMAASDFIVLQGYKQLLDAFHADRLKHGVREEAVAKETSPLYLKLQVLRAAATGRGIELQAPAGDSRQSQRLRGTIEALRHSLSGVEAEGLLKITFLPASAIEADHDKDVSNLPDLQTQGDPVKRAKRAAMEVGQDQAGKVDPQRQASLLMQEMAGQRTADLGGTPSAGTRTAPSPMSLLTAQAA